MESLDLLSIVHNPLDPVSSDEDLMLPLVVEIHDQLERATGARKLALVLRDRGSVDQNLLEIHARISREKYHDPAYTIAFETVATFGGSEEVETTPAGDMDMILVISVANLPRIMDAVRTYIETLA